MQKVLILETQNNKDLIVWNMDKIENFSIENFSLDKEMVLRINKTSTYILDSSIESDKENIIIKIIDFVSKDTKVLRLRIKKLEGEITMANMSYCRFRNTLNDLLDCRDNIDDNLEGEEFKARTSLITVCKEIAEIESEDENYGFHEYKEFSKEEFEDDDFEESEENEEEDE